MKKFNFDKFARIFYALIILYIYLFIAVDILGLNPEDDGDIAFFALTPFIGGPFLLAFLFVISDRFSQNKLLVKITYTLIGLLALLIFVANIFRGIKEGVFVAFRSLDLYIILLLSPVIMHAIYTKISKKKILFYTSAALLVGIFCMIYPARNYIESIIYNDPCRTKNLIERQYAGSKDDYQSVYKGVVCMAQERPYKSETFQWVKNDLVDPKTFKYLGQGYSVDKNNVFYKGEKILADPQTFTVNPSWKSDEMANFIKRRGSYMRDAQRVYFEGKILPVENIDNFRIIDICNSYRCATDGVKVFKDGKVIEAINAEDLVSFNTCEYAKDKKYVYHAMEVIEEADVESFNVYGEKKYCYAYDKSHVYYKGEIVSDATPIALKRIPKDDVLSPYYTDGKNIFYDGKKINIDINNYEYLGKSTIKDAFSVYYRDKKIERADPQTFELVPTITIETVNMCARDKNNRYFDGEVYNHSACKW